MWRNLINVKEVNPLKQGLKLLGIGDVHVAMRRLKK